MFNALRIPFACYQRTFSNAFLVGKIIIEINRFILNGASKVSNSSRYLCSRVPKQYANGTLVLWSIAYQS